MKIDAKSPPRSYRCGTRQQIEIKDCGRVMADADEQLTFVTPNGGEYDLARKSWGFYATPSINGRLASFGFRTVLVKNKIGQFFVMLVERGYEDDFQAYLADENLTVVTWFDDKSLDRLSKLFDQAG